jgi:hypothetical protein
MQCGEGDKRKIKKRRRKGKKLRRINTTKICQKK